MKLLPPVLQFRLRDDHSVGYEALRSMWAAACNDNDVRVSRKLVGTSSSGYANYLYCLYPPAIRFDLALAESRMTLSLRARYPSLSVVLQRL
ncbi:hypothetical protein [Dokdonella sp.]|uniref:hypothetical protein n=1 Tax=Dokdonella sp. TaxID=2291710 RepID=UPI0026023FA4|nr:hypothetical protein [Dokdonella sp.]